MIIPKFLIADNSEYPENVYVVHTETPRFIIDIDSEEIEWLDVEPIKNIAETLVVQAFEFYESELDAYDEEDED